MLKLSAAILAVSLSGVLNAQTRGVLKEDDIVKMALERNEVSAITKNQIEQAEIRIKQARSYMFPTLKANATWSKMYIVPEKHLPGGIERRAGEVSLVQPIYTFGRLSTGVEMAKLGNDITKNNAKATISEIVKTAKQLYYSAAFNKNVLKIAQESLSNANSNKSALNERVSFGRINQNDNIKMQADVASRKPLLYEATKGYESALHDLSSFLDLPVEQVQNIDTNLADASPVPLVEKNVDQFVDVANAANQRQLSLAQEKLAKDDYMPTLSAFASYLPVNANISLPGVLMTDTAQIGLRLDFELPLGGTKIQERKIKTIDRVNAELNLKRVRREADKQQSSLIQQYATLTEKNKSIEEAVRLAERSYRVALQSFRNGSISQLQLNDSELLATNNKIAKAQNLLQMKLIRIELERLQTEGKR